MQIIVDKYTEMYFEKVCIYGFPSFQVSERRRVPIQTIEELLNNAPFDLQYLGG